MVSYLRIRKLRLMSSGFEIDALEVGVFRPKMTASETLVAGEVGYVATGLKTVRDIQVGDTHHACRATGNRAASRLSSRQADGVRRVLSSRNERLSLVARCTRQVETFDASLTFEPETSAALGFGFRCGFLGLLHMEIVQERLEREYDLNLIATAPSVEYHVLKNNGDVINVDNPAEMPGGDEIAEIEEPWMHIQIFTPKDYIGPIMDLVVARRGTFDKMEYLDELRVMLTYNIPLSELIIDFYDKLKSRTRGYASLDYSFGEYRASDLVKMNILVNDEPVDALSMIVHKDYAYPRGAVLCKKLKELIPSQLFPVPIQAAIGGRIISRETIRALRKDVLAKCYGGDISRKRKLLEKQKEGKKRMKRFGNVEIPQDAFMAVLKLGDD